VLIMCIVWTDWTESKDMKSFKISGDLALTSFDVCEEIKDD